MLITNYDIGYINNEVINRCSKLSYYNLEGNSKKINFSSSKITNYNEYKEKQKFLNRTNKNYTFRKS